MAIFFGIVLPGLIAGVLLALFISVPVGMWFQSALGGILAFVISFVIVAGGVIGYNVWKIENTESGARAYHSLEADYEGGIEREVIVYNIQGEVIEHYQGRFDVTYDDDRIMFDDEDGKRHIIFYTTSNVIINEL